MPAHLNNALTAADYAEAATVEYPKPGRTGFTASVSEAGVYYQLAYIARGENTRTWEFSEHLTPPAFMSFTDTLREGLPDGSRFGGIRFRSSGTTPARVSVA